MPICNGSHPTVQALSDQIEFDRLLFPKADIEESRQKRRS